MITNVHPGDIIRVKGLPEYKGKTFTAVSIYYHLVEIEIGVFIEKTLIQKKYHNKFIPILCND